MAACRFGKIPTARSTHAKKMSRMTNGLWRRLETTAPHGRFSKNTPQTVNGLIQDLKIHEALENIMSLLRKINRYLEVKAPWKSIKEDDSQKSSAATTLALSADVLRIGSQLLNPVMPEKTSAILNILGANAIPLSDTTLGLLEVGSSIGKGKSPFPRIVTE